MTTKEWKLVIDRLKNIEGHHIFFLTGGEPLCRNDIYELIEYCVHKSDIPAVLATNGTLIDSHIASVLKKCGIQECRISLDGSNDKVNGLIRHEGSFERTLKGIRHLQQSRILVTVRTTITKINQNDIINIGDLLLREGVLAWEIKHLIPRGRACSAPKLSLNFEDRNTVIKEIINECNKGRFKELHIRFMEGTFNFLYDKKASVDTVTRCPAGKRMLLIQSNGDIIPCGYLSHLNIGNVRHDNIDFLWSHSPILYDLRNKPVPKGCKDCDKYNLCRGGCLAHDFCPKKCEA